MNPGKTKIVIRYLDSLVNSRTIFLIPVFFFILFYLPLLTGMNHMWEDVLKYHYPNLVYTVNSLKQGEIPLWTPHIFAGMPYMADLQTAVFYPPHWILYLARGIFSSSDIIFTWFILGHVLLLGFGMVRLCQDFGMKRAASVYAATAMMFCGFISLHTHHLNALYVVSWFPWSFLYLKRYFDSHRPKHLGFASLLFGISTLAGYAQYTAFSLLILLFYTLYAAWSKRSKGFRSVVASCLAFCQFLFLSLGLSLVQLLPTAELAFQSTRLSMGWAESVHGSLSLSHLITILAPKFFGQVSGMNGTTFLPHQPMYLFWETALFIGIIPLILLAIRLPYRNKGRMFFFFLTVGIFGLIMAMGKHLPIYSLFYHLPGFNTFRIPGRYSFIFAFGFITASAVSLNDLQSQHTGETGYPKRGLILGIIVSALMMISLAMATQLIEIPQVRKSATIHSVILALFTILIAWILITWLIRSKTKTIPALAIIFFVFFELFLFAHRFALGPIAGRQVYPPRGIFHNIRKQSQTSRFRLHYRNIPTKDRQSIRILGKNLGNVYGIDTINGYNQLRLSRFSRFMKEIEFEKARQLLNVKYELNVTGAGVQKSQSLKSCSRFNLRSDLIPVDDDREAIDCINKSSFNPLSQATIEAIQTLPMNKEIPPHMLGSIRIKSYRPHKIILDIRTEHNSLLFASEIWYPGWKARLNNREVPILLTNYLFRGVEIPAGNHRLTFYYSSALFDLGKWISLFFLISIVLIVCVVPEVETSGFNAFKQKK